MTRGGPIHALERRARLAPTDPQRALRLVLALVVVAWLPAVVFALVERALGRPWDPLVLGGRMHVRLLLALPLLVVAELSLERRCSAAVRHLLTEPILPPDREGAFQSVLRRVERVRDSRVPELLIVVAVYALTAASVADVVPDRLLRWILSAGHHIGVGPTYTPASVWYLLVGEPLFAILLFRWVFRWALWGAFLARIPGHAPRVEAAHADRAGGLAFLGSPLMSIRFTWLAVASALAAVWFDEVAIRGVMPAAFAGDLVVFVLLAVGLAALPYLVLTPTLVAGKRKGLLAYSAVVRRYVREFDGRWIHGSGGDPLRDSENFSGLTDLGTSFEVVVEMRGTIFDFGELRSQAIVALTPFVPILLFHSGSAAELVRRLVGRVL